MKDRRLGSRTWLTYVAEDNLQRLSTSWMRSANRDYDAACIRLAKKYGLDKYTTPLFIGSSQ